MQFLKLNVFKIDLSFENRHKHIISKRKQVHWKIKAYTAVSLKINLGWFSTKKLLSILHTSGFYAHI